MDERISGKGDHPKRVAVNELNHAQERFNAYLSAISRFRWFLLFTIIVSGVALLHVYIERLGYQEAQLKGYLSIKDERNKEICQLEKDIGSLESKNQAIEKALENDKSSESTKKEKEEEKKKNSEKLLSLKKDYYELIYFNIRTENTLKETKLADRDLPILGFPIPENDYLPVLAMMNVIFMVGTWLNLRAIGACLLEIEKAGELDSIRDLLRLHFTFTGIVDEKIGGILGAFIQFLAFALPVIVIFFAILLDIYSFFMMLTRMTHGFAGSNGAIIARIILMVFLFFIMIILTKAIIGKAKELDMKIKAND